MGDTNTWAKRMVAGWELHLRRAPWEERWEISLCDRILNLKTALMDGELRWIQLRNHQILRETFATPDEAAARLHQILVA